MFLGGFFTVLLASVDLNSDGTVFRTENSVWQSEGVPVSLGLFIVLGHRMLTYSLPVLPEMLGELNLSSSHQTTLYRDPPLSHPFPNPALTPRVWVISPNKHREQPTVPSGSAWLMVDRKEIKQKGDH